MQVSYKGLVHAFIDEIPVGGPHRLIRKLSVDADDFIPVIIKLPHVQRRLIGIAHDLATKAWHGDCDTITIQRE